jgi:hypothetical protein
MEELLERTDEVHRDNFNHVEEANYPTHEDYQHYSE